MVMTRIKRCLLLLWLVCACLFGTNQASAQEDWTHKVRTTAFPLSATNVDTIVKQAGDSYISGIEIDNDITGRYLSFLDPTKELSAIKALAAKAHQAGNHAFVYIAGLECITPNADTREHTFFKDHPDWVQRDINGKPAVFGGGIAFWVRGKDEDVWISPYAKQWRALFMERVRQIAATGIDGLYVDVPYWMTHYEGWENTWASFDDYTVAAFKTQTGLDARKDIKLGEFNDPLFARWVQFRIETLTDFFAEIHQNIQAVNPACKLIPEIYPGLDESVPIVGTDVYQLYAIADVVTHEYHEGKVYAAEREPFDWFNFIAGIRTFRAFAERKPTWLLSYSWYQNETVLPSEAMKSLFASEAFSGANVWDARGYVMSSSNDMNTRKQVYKWIAANENSLYGTRTNDLNEVGIYFSPGTRDLFPNNYVDSFRGAMLLLMNNHLDYQIVTPRTLDSFNGKILILDNVQCVSDKEVEWLKALMNKGTHFLITTNSGAYDEHRVSRPRNVLTSVFGIHDASRETRSDIVTYLNRDPGAEYFSILSKNLDSCFHSSEPDKRPMEKSSSTFGEELARLTHETSPIRIQAPVEIVSTIASDQANIYINLMNVRQLCVFCNSGQRSDSIRIMYSASVGSGNVSMTPFLDDTFPIRTNLSGNDYGFVVPKFNRGAIICIKRK